MPTQLEKKSAELAAKQDSLAKIFSEAKTDEGIDLTKSASLGITDNQKALEKIRELNTELDALGTEVGELAEVQKAASEVGQAIKHRKSASHQPEMPGGDGGKGHPAAFKSVGELVAQDERYLNYAKRNAPGGIDFKLDHLPSDMFAKASQFATMGAKALMTTDAGWGPESVRLPGFVEGVSRPLQLLDIIPVAQTGQEQVVYMEETTRTHAAAETAEGGTYNESEFVLTERTSPVRKITDSLPVTDEQLEDVAQVQSYINGRLVFGVRQRLDGQVLLGDGAGSNLIGLENLVGKQTQAKGADPVPDAFYKAMVKVRVTGRAMPTHHVMNPTDWQGVRLLRTADGMYIWGNPSEAGPERMWGLPVVQQDAGAAGTGYVGSFMPQWVNLFERRGIDVQVGYTGTQFTEGKRTVRADMRAALVFYRPSAFAEVTGL